MTASHALVLTREVLPSFTPELVWPKLAEYLHMEPEKLMQLLARAPLTIKSGNDPAPLQALQAAIAAIGGKTELCQTDERPALFVVIDGSARGPIPRVMAEQRVRQGLWPDSISATQAGSSGWRPYRDLDAPAVAPPPGFAAAPIATAPSALPAGEAIHAGFWRRAAAYLLDHLILAIPFGLLFVIHPATVYVSLAGKWLYFALMESSAWQATPGKRAMGIKVTNQFGQRIGFGRASGRFFAAFVSFIFSQIGYTMAAFTPRKQGFHDMVAGTFVVFNAVLPGQPLPTKRPPMPWYGWALNTLFLGPFVITFAVGGYAIYDRRGNQAKASQAIAAAAAMAEEIAREGCQSGTRASPHPWIQTVTVLRSTSSKSRRSSPPATCAVEFTFLQAPEVPQDMRNSTLTITSGDGEQPSCASARLLRKYLPSSCRASDD